MATIIVKPYSCYPPVNWENRTEVIKAWYQNKTFYTPYEINSCMSRHDFKKYGNKLDGVTYKFNNLTIELDRGII